MKIERIFSIMSTKDDEIADAKGAWTFSQRGRKLERARNVGAFEEKAVDDELRARLRIE